MVQWQHTWPDELASCGGALGILSTAGTDYCRKLRLEPRNRLLPAGVSAPDKLSYRTTSRMPGWTCPGDREVTG